MEVLFVSPPPAFCRGYLWFRTIGVYLCFVVWCPSPGCCCPAPLVNVALYAMPVHIRLGSNFDRLLSCLMPTRFLPRRRTWISMYIISTSSCHRKSAVLYRIHVGEKKSWQDIALWQDTPSNSVPSPLLIRSVPHGCVL